MSAGTNLSSAVALTRRNLANFVLSRFALVGVLLVPVVLLLGLGTLYSRAIERTGVDYVDFVVPGVALQAAMFASVASAWTLAADRLSGFHRLVLLFADRPRVIIAGRVLTDMCKYGMALIVVLALGTALGFTVHGGPAEAALALAFAFAFAAVCSLGYAAAGCHVRQFRLVQAVTMAPFPLLFLLSSAISPVRNYPHWLQPLIRNTPVSVLSEAVRGLLEHRHPSLVPALEWLLGAAIVFGVIAARGLRTFRSVS